MRRIFIVTTNYQDYDKSGPKILKAYVDPVRAEAYRAGLELSVKSYGEAVKEYEKRMLEWVEQNPRPRFQYKTYARKDHSEADIAHYNRKIREWQAAYSCQPDPSKEERFREIVEYYTYQFFVEEISLEEWRCKMNIFQLLFDGSPRGKVVTVQLRRDTTARWKEVNPILKEGEPGYVTDKKRIKVGDGTTSWNHLPFVGLSAPDGMVQGEWFGLYSQITGFKGKPE